MDQLYTHFYNSLMKQDMFTHPTVLMLNRRQERTDKKEENYDKQRKIWDIPEIPKRTFSKFLQPIRKSGNWESYCFVRRNYNYEAIYCIPKKNKGYGIQIYKLCNSTGYIHHTAQHFTATNATVTELTLQGELLFFPWLVCWWNRQKTVVGLSAK